jgi:hypothetical protein
MSIGTGVGICLVALGLGGCIIEAGGGPPPPPPVITVVPTTAQVVRIEPGAGTIVQPGVQAGYGITANVGSSYRILWTGDASASLSYREFTGSIYTAGNFTSVTPGCANNFCALEAGDYVSPPTPTTGGTRIDFDTIATTGLDGLDFIVDSEPVYFDLNIDGVPYPNLVLFTSGTTNQTTTAPGNPFGLTTQ